MNYRLGIVVIAIVVIIFTVILVRENKGIDMPFSADPKEETSPFSEWKDFKADEGGFAVKLPNLPQNAKEIFNDKKTQQQRFYDIYVSEKPDSTLFTIIIIKYPQGGTTQSPEILVQGVVDEMMKSNPKNRVVDTEKIQFHGHDALRFDIINEKMQINGLAFNKDNTLYILSYTAHVDKHRPEEYQHFIDSFKLL